MFSLLVKQHDERQIGYDANDGLAQQSTNDHPTTTTTTNTNTVPTTINNNNNNNNNNDPNYVYNDFRPISSLKQVNSLSNRIFNECLF